MIADEEAQYECDEGNLAAKIKSKPVGPPLELEIALCPPPASPDKLNLIKVSNIELKKSPLIPRHIQKRMFLWLINLVPTAKKRIRLDTNIVRWRIVRKPDGTESYESNARFVRWSDGSLQLLIGNEVLDISVQDAQPDQGHLFLQHGKRLIQSQGRILSKMKFMPSSLSSKSRRLLTALVDLQHKKVYKVKNCVTDIDPEREKEQKEKEQQLSPGFLEDALEEEDEPDYYESRRAGRSCFDEDKEMEALAEKCLANAKKRKRDIPRKSSVSLPSHCGTQLNFQGVRERSLSMKLRREKRRPPHRRRNPEEDDPDEEEEAVNEESEEEPEEEPKQQSRMSGSSLKQKEIESGKDSPPRKTVTHRKMAVVFDSDDE